MVVRIPWDKYEVALLIETAVNIEEKRVSREYGVAKLSEQLRTKAANSGMEIDPIFRNKNGISMQLNIISSLLFNRKNGLHDATQLFYNMVKMYHTDSESFSELLKEAKQMVEQPKDHQSLFYQYVQSRQSAFFADQIMLVMQKIDSFAVSNGVVKGSIYDEISMSRVALLRKKVIYNKSFSMNNRSVMKYAEVGLRLFSSYVSSTLLKVAKEKEDEKAVVEQIKPNEPRNTYVRSIDKSDSNAERAVSERADLEIEIASQDGFVRWMVEQRGLSINSARCYRSSINTCDDFAHRNRIYVPYIAKCRSLAEFDECFDAIMNNDDFKEFSANKYNSLSLALKKLYEYMHSDYSRETTAAASAIKNISHQPKTIPEVTLQDDFIRWMVEQRGMSINSARSYRSSINTIDSFAHRNGIYTAVIFKCDSFAEFTECYNAIMNNEAFKLFSASKHNSLTVALNKLFEYQQSVASGENEVTTLMEKINLSDGTFQMVNAILRENFEEGYRIGYYMHQIRFINACEDVERDVKITEDNVDDIVKSAGMVIEDRVFAKKSDVNNELIADIIADIETAFSKGATAVYFESLFEKYNSSLSSEMKIYSADTLRTLLLNNSRLPIGYKISRSMIEKYGVEADYVTEVKEILRESHTPLSADDIHATLWYIPLEKIITALRRISEAVNTDTLVYYYAPNFYISTEEKYALITAMHSAIYSKGFISTKELRSIFRNNCPSAAMDYECFKDHAIRDIIGFHLQNEFEFTYSMVAEKGVVLDYGIVYQQFVAEHSKITLAELKEFSDELGTNIYWNSVLKEMIRISSTELVRKDLVHFDVNAIDEELEHHCSGDYIPLKDINLFLSFPDCGYRWNGFVLESYLRDYSHKFRLVQLSISNDDYFGIMARNSSLFSSFDDIAADMLAKSHGWNDEKTALKCLVDAKFQQRNSNKNIGLIIKKAKQLRDEFE